VGRTRERGRRFLPMARHRKEEAAAGTGKVPLVHDTAWERGRKGKAAMNPDDGFRGRQSIGLPEKTDPSESTPDASNSTRFTTFVPEHCVDCCA
jgi:hypothetical protein